METNVKVIRKDAYRVMKTATVVDKILKVLQGFAIAGMIIAVIFLVLTAIFGEKAIVGETVALTEKIGLQKKLVDASTVEVAGMDVKLNGEPAEFLNIPWAVGYLCCVLGTLLISCGASWFGLRALRNILSSMKEGEVFAEGISRKIRNLGTTVLIGGGIAEVASKVTEVVHMRAYNWDVLLNKAMVAEIDYGSQISFWFALAALVLYFLSFVFLCGEQLQKESDETL